jgi:putative exosortase-associated protein (TIGR04073 family)
MMRGMSMLRKWNLPVVSVAVLCLSLASAAVAQAEEQSDPAVPVQIGAKLMRGVVNLATGVGEFPKQIYLIGDKEGWVQGVFRGPVEGLGMFIARTVGGAYEIVTFLIPLPSGYQPMLLPEYVWQPEPVSQLAVPAEPVAPRLTPSNR